MKKSTLVLSAVSVMALFSTMAFADGGATFKDYVYEEGDIVTVVEKPNETILWVHNGATNKAKKKMKEYCENHGGHLTNNNCNGSNDDFSYTGKTTYFRPVLLNGEFPDETILVAHKNQQLAGYVEKYWHHQNIDFKDFQYGFFGGAHVIKDFYLLKGYCEENGGKFLIVNTDTDGYAVKVNDYISFKANGTGNIKTVYVENEKMYCIDTADQSKEFESTYRSSEKDLSGTMSYQGFRSGFKFGHVDRSLIKYNTEPVPSYLIKKDKTPDQIGTAMSAGMNSALGVQQPTNVGKASDAITALAVKSLNTKNTSMARNGGRIYEGMYLGQSSDGCELSAVWTAPDQPLDHKIVYTDKGRIDHIDNFKQCRNQAVQYTGESYEKRIPTNIASEIDRVVSISKIRGIAMSSYLGYDITSERQGAGYDISYEVSVLKKDKLVGRFYTK